LLEHGGQLRSAAARYNIPLQDWLDLSTGINPIPFIPPPIPVSACAQLPQENDGLEQAAADYYGTVDLLVVAGSQAAIQALPRLRKNSRVGVLHPGYAEHAHAWQRCGHEVLALNENQIEEQLITLDVLVLIQPNNPTGALFTHAQLHGWHAQLAAHDGCLIVDEAFVDVIPDTSILRSPTLAPSPDGRGKSSPSPIGGRVGMGEHTVTMPPGLIVLRSLGKFFGLAGARVGFAAAHPTLLEPLRELLGPWPISGPSRFVAQAALRDTAWQAATRQRLQQNGQRLAQLLRDAGFAPVSGCGLFQWVVTDQAEKIHQQLAQQGIFTRLFSVPHSLRFGLPASEAGWARLHDALEHTT
jgi:cobalamin biosynthetic protein CobC